MAIHRIKGVSESHEDEEGVIQIDMMECSCGYEGNEEQMEKHVLSLHESNPGVATT